jgi:hypothetical protein
MIYTVYSPTRSTPNRSGKSITEDFRYGANFAVASATALKQLLFEEKNLNVKQITPYSLSVQVKWFKKVLATLATTDHGTPMDDRHVSMTVCRTLWFCS